MSFFEIIFWILIDLRSSWHLRCACPSRSPGKSELGFILEAGFPDLDREASHFFPFSYFFFISNLHFAALVRQQEALGFLSRAFSWRDVLTTLITVAGKERNTPTLQKAWPSSSLSLPSPCWAHFPFRALETQLGLHNSHHTNVQANFIFIKIWFCHVPGPCPSFR